MRAVLVVLLSVILASVAGTARAQNFYVGVQGGYNDVFESDFNEFCLFLCGSDNSVATPDYGGGLAFGGVIGFDMASGLRLEGEYTYRENDFRSIGWTDAVRATSGTVRSRAYMANVYYDLGSGSVQPYIGAGGGVMTLEFDDVSDANGPLFDGEQNLLAGQLMIGIGIAPLPNTMLYMDYRALYVEDAHFTFAGTQRAEIAGEPFDARYWSQSIMVGVRQSF